MKLFRHFRIFAVLLAAFGIFAGAGCQDKCGSTTCQNGGTCTDNVCVCPLGYSGNSCQTGWSSGVIGTYHCTSKCNPYTAGDSTWISSVTADATNGGYTVDISNFGNTNVTQIAEIDSSQKVELIQGAGINATGIYGNDTLRLSYTIVAAGGPGQYKCTMLMVKE